MLEDLGNRLEQRGLLLVADVPGARLHLTHVSTAASLTHVRAAKAAGLPLEVLAYSVNVDTANGRTRAAPVTLDRLVVGEIVERSVPIKALEDCLDLIPDSAIDAIFVAGDPVQCTEKLREVAAMARQHGYRQLMFSELGPDEEEALHLLCDEVLPGL